MDAQQVPYYVGRLEKIDKRLLKNSILVSTWVYDNSLKLYRGHTPESESKAWSEYLKDKSIKNRNNLFNGYVWYAAYVAYYKFISQTKGRRDYLSFNDILQFCLEKLVYCIEKYDIDKSALFYTYYLHNIKIQLTSSMKCLMSHDNDIGIHSFDAYFKIRSLMNHYNENIHDISNMDNCEYNMKYGFTHISKKKFINLYSLIELMNSLNELMNSLNEYIGDDNTNDSTLDRRTELLYTLEDDKSESVDNFIDKEFIDNLVDKILNYAKCSKDRFVTKRNVEMLLYRFKGYTFEEIPGIINSKVSRQRVQQITSKLEKILSDSIYDIFSCDEISEIRTII